MPKYSLLVLPQIIGIVFFLQFIKLVNCDDFVLPKSFEGIWNGIPTYSMVGPWKNLSIFSISRASNGDYLIEDKLSFDGLNMGYQRFYIQGTGTNAGYLWYCGFLSNFTDGTEAAGSLRPDNFKAVSFPKISDNNVTFCLDSANSRVMGIGNPYAIDCQSCGCVNWTLSYDDESKILTSNVIMSGQYGSTHLYVTLKKIGESLTPNNSLTSGNGLNFACDFSDGGRDSTPPILFHDSKHIAMSTGCPYLKFKNKQKSPNDQPFITSMDSNSRNYEFCYSLNEFSGFQLSWTLEPDKQLIHVQISAKTIDKSSYVAIGFRPLGRSANPSTQSLETGRHTNFAMQGADIVVGSAKKGVRKMYAKEYVGPPIPSNSLNITQAEVIFLESHEGNRTVLKFTRPYISGYLLTEFGVSASIITSVSDIIWAVGQDFDENSKEPNDSTCSYHENMRGYRYIDWESPQISMVDSWKCSGSISSNNDDESSQSSSLNSQDNESKKLKLSYIIAIAVGSLFICLLLLFYFYSIGYKKKSQLSETLLDSKTLAF